MSSAQGHKHTGSMTQNHKAQLANAYNELGKELSSTKVKVVGNYTLGKIIGEGAYGKVRLGTHRLTSTRVAIKQIPKSVSSSLTREIHHHRQLHHPHVTQMYEVLATESSIWIVTELCCGGELFDYLVEKGRLGEEETRILFGQLCLAVAYLHEKGIVHRDLKLENILLDERCRIKLGDFGFTREFERGSLLETFCGTTGYASPEMLQGKKYQGPEVDVWSLGVILYCLLTGTLPFDDDDEGVMRDKIIKGDFEDPMWLTTDSRDLIQNILQKDPANRLTIRQILSHAWFVTPPNPSNRQPTSSQHGSVAPSPEPFQLPSLELSSDISPISPSAFSTIPTSSELNTSASLALDDMNFDSPKPNGVVSHFSSSDATLTKTETYEQIQSWMGQPIADKTDRTQSPRLPETSDGDLTLDGSSHPAPRPTSGPKPPPAYSLRTPVRTKRRSVSSNLSDPASPTVDKLVPSLPRQDFASLLNTPAPIIFSTPLERNLLTSLSTLGFDTAQIVHSVLSDACDAAGAVWWMLKRKTEKKSLEAGEGKATQETSDQLPSHKANSSTHPDGDKRGVSVQTDVASLHSQVLSATRSAPQLAFLPPTPTLPRPETPPNSQSSVQQPLLSPSPGSSSRSHPSTPAGSLRSKDGAKGRRDGKMRSGSVSIMQRATTALEAAGLVRKRSVEAVREDKEKEREREREKSKETERRVTSGEEPRSSHGSGSSRRTKSTYSRSTKDHTVPSTPPSEAQHSQTQVGSPWVVADAHSPPNAPAPTPANSPIPSHSGLRDNAGKATGTRHRASLLTAFRLWFNDDRKGKRKESNQPPASGSSWTPVHNRPNSGIGTAKRRTSGRFASRKAGHRAHRPSVSSRRSSSANSRRSSAASAQIILLDPPHIIEQLPTRRSIGSHTPNSERGDFSSRPSSVQSFSMQRHRKSPSASSAGSAHFRTASPLQKYHKRTGSGSSTRVVRQVQPHSSGARHTRSNSTSSSIHTPASSRPVSFYEPPEGDVPRTVSPFKTPTRRSFDENRKPTHGSSTTFVAQKRQAPFMSPGSHIHGNSIGRSSWKKSWGLEPPGWQSRTAHVPVEVLAISPAVDAQNEIRDVFSGRKSLNLGDESDWVDEDDDIPAFAGGLGQMAASAPNSSSFGHHIPEPIISLSPPPRGHRAGKRVNRNAGIVPAISTGRQKSAHSPVERASPIPTENNYEASEVRGGRRQLPPRSGPAFRHAIQEEDEGEEE